MEKCGCYKLCESLCWPLEPAPGGQFRPILALKNGGFLIIFIIILRFIWDLGLLSFDSPKVVVSGKILVFGNIFNFLGLNWAQKWTKTENFGCVPFVLKHTNFETLFLHCLFAMMDYLWSKFQQIRALYGRERAKKPPKRAHFMAAALPQKHLKIYNFGTTNTMLMELTRIMYHQKIFHLAKIWGVAHRA